MWYKMHGETVKWNLQKTVYSLYIISKEYNLEIATKKTKVFGFVGTDYLRKKNVTNDETLEQVDQFTYVCCSTSYQFSNDVESKLAKFLHLTGTINTFAASYLNTQGLNNSCLKSPASTLVDLTFQSRKLRSFSLNQLRNLSL